MEKSVCKICVLIAVLFTSNLALSQGKYYPYIKDSSAIAIDSKIVALLCKNEWQLIELRETLRGEERSLNLSSVFKYNPDGSFAESKMNGKFEIENSFFLKHFDVAPQNGTDKPLIDGVYFISRIDEKEMILTKYATSSLDWKKRYIFKKRGSI